MTALPVPQSPPVEPERRPIPRIGIVADENGAVRPPASVTMSDDERDHFQRVMREHAAQEARVVETTVSAIVRTPMPCDVCRQPATKFISCATYRPHPVRTFRCDACDCTDYLMAHDYPFTVEPVNRRQGA